MSTHCSQVQRLTVVIVCAAKFLSCCSVVRAPGTCAGSMAEPIVVAAVVAAVAVDGTKGLWLSGWTLEAEEPGMARLAAIVDGNMAELTVLIGTRPAEMGTPCVEAAVCMGSIALLSMAAAAAAAAAEVGSVAVVMGTAGSWVMAAAVVVEDVVVAAGGGEEMLVLAASLLCALLLGAGASCCCCCSAACCKVSSLSFWLELFSFLKMCGVQASCQESTGGGGGRSVFIVCESVSEREREREREREGLGRGRRQWGREVRGHRTHCWGSSGCSSRAAVGCWPVVAGCVQAGCWWQGKERQGKARDRERARREGQGRHVDGEARRKKKKQKKKGVQGVKGAKLFYSNESLRLAVRPGLAAHGGVVVQRC